MAWMDGRSRAAGTGGKPEQTARAAAWLMRCASTSKAGQTKGREDGQADGPNQTKIALLVSFKKPKCAENGREIMLAFVW